MLDANDSPAPSCSVPPVSAPVAAAPVANGDAGSPPRRRVTAKFLDNLEDALPGRARARDRENLARSFENIAADAGFVGDGSSLDPADPKVEAAQLLLSYWFHELRRISGRGEDAAYPNPNDMEWSDAEFACFHPAMFDVWDNIRTGDQEFPKSDYQLDVLISERVAGRLKATRATSSEPDSPPAAPPAPLPSPPASKTARDTVQTPEAPADPSAVAERPSSVPATSADPADDGPAAPPAPLPSAPVARTAPDTVTVAETTRGPAASVSQKDAAKLIFGDAGAVAKLCGRMNRAKPSELFYRLKTEKTPDGRMRLDLAELVARSIHEATRDELADVERRVREARSSKVAQVPARPARRDAGVVRLARTMLATT